MTITPELITSIATLIGVISGVIVSIRNSGKLDEVHKVANSLSDKRDEATHKSAYAEGQLEAKNAATTEELARKAAFDSGAKSAFPPN